MQVAVVDTGTANLASMLAALRRHGVEPVLTGEARVVAEARLLVLPGVGAFGAGMAKLGEHALVAPLAARVRTSRPTLAVCLGLQMLGEASEETPGVEGIGVVPAMAQRFPAAVDGQRLVVPQLGWNAVEPRADVRLLEAGHAYYANSFHLASIPEGWSGAESTHGVRFVAALERGPVLACQFHPELSGAWGHALIGRWLARGASC
ncbi:MAG: imidazole glycerol phosphate synthase subunit HisH [Deltaproteobacteria bacterium]|nr:imidazole glycerol phosphate synthase subunit HisH [Deltaproteobacteria bacterium]